MMYVNGLVQEKASLAVFITVEQLLIAFHR